MSKALDTKKWHLQYKKIPIIVGHNDFTEYTLILIIRFDMGQLISFQHMLKF